MRTARQIAHVAQATAELPCHALRARARNATTAASDPRGFAGLETSRGYCRFT